MCCSPWGGKELDAAERLNRVLLGSRFQVAVVGSVHKAAHFFMPSSGYPGLPREP